MKTAARAGQFRRGHEDQRIFQVVGIHRSRFHLLNQVCCIHDFKIIFPKGLHRFIIPVITQHHAFFQGQQVAGIRPLFPGIKWKFIVAGINKFHFPGTLQILFADIRQQIFQVVEINWILRYLFSGTG